MHISEFDFLLPKELIASRPVKPRSSSRLLYAKNNYLRDLQFLDLPKLLVPGDLLVFNNTRVIPALILGSLVVQGKSKEHWREIEFLLVERLSLDSWLCLCKSSRKISIKTQFIFSKELSGKVLNRTSDGVIIKFQYSGDFFNLLKQCGQMPLPPYIRKLRAVDGQDAYDYQPIFSSEMGSIASPTASLHFDHELIRTLFKNGVKSCFVTLHVGLGTFTPVRVENIHNHRMHEEIGEINMESAQIINRTIASGQRVIAVGTTSLRILESVARDNGKITSFKGGTDIYITPGFVFKVTSALITNFHLPKSSLFILIASFIGLKEAKKLYAHAINKKYRFYSYGDASLLMP